MPSPVDSDLEQALQGALASLVRQQSSTAGPPQVDEAVRGPLVSLLDSLPHVGTSLLERAVAVDPDAEPLIRRYALRLEAFAGLLSDTEALGAPGVEALLHRIAGTAGCYGFTTIAACAARCRDRVSATGGPLPAHLLRPVLDEIDRL